MLEGSSTGENIGVNVFPSTHLWQRDLNREFIGLVGCLLALHTLPGLSADL